MPEPVPREPLKAPTFTAPENRDATFVSHKNIGPPEHPSNPNKPNAKGPFLQGSFQPPWFFFHPRPQYNQRAMENLTHTHQNAAPKPRTAAQIAASRANGTKSKGPVTPEGKSISARNAERHGLFSHLATIKGESPQEYAAVSADLYETWQPVDEYERCLVDTMATSMWRRMRMLALESLTLDIQPDRLRMHQHCRPRPDRPRLFYPLPKGRCLRAHPPLRIPLPPGLRACRPLTDGLRCAAALENGSRMVNFTSAVNWIDFPLESYSVPQQAPPSAFQS